jgi:8-hydroxy-5-deazaflavin:NADPH oxidoreductase
MNVTIIGTGNMARGIATRFLAGGHQIQLVGHTLEKAQTLAMELGGVNLTSAQTGEPITNDIIVLAVWHPVTLELARGYGPQWAGKTLVNISNPLNATYDGLTTPPGLSSAEELAYLAPDTHVVKAFNTNFAGTLVAGQVAGLPLDVFIAGDDANVKANVAQLIASSGMRPIDVGVLKRAQYLEGLGLLHITLQFTLGTNWASAVKIIA